MPLLHAVHVLARDPCFFVCMRLHRQKGADPGAGLIPSATTRFEEVSNLTELLVEQESEVLRCVRGDGQDAGGQVSGEAFAEYSLEQLVEEGDGSPRIAVQDLLADLVEPVLLIITHGVDRAKRAGVIRGELDQRVPCGLTYACLETDRTPSALVEDL